MKNLEKIGLVTKNEMKKRYELLILDPNVAALIPYDTLKLLVDTLSENSISSYVYLLSRYIANGENGFIVTLAKNVVAKAPAVVPGINVFEIIGR